jgi:hypothetical protein
MKNNELKKFAQMLSEELKKTKEISVEKTPTELVEESPIDLVSKYLSNHKTQNVGIKPVETISQINEVISNPENIEKQRWADPLKPVDQKFVTFKDMNDHYGLFLQRIQQQMSSIGGGGEVKFARLDDISSSTVGTNKYLTYNQATKKFYFNTIGTGEGIYLNGDNEVTLNVASPTVLGGIKVGEGFEIDVSDKLQLRVATNTDLGGIKLGPGVTVNNQDQIIIDSSGLDFSFGDFVATTPGNGAATLSSINTGQNIDIVSSANGVISVVGNFHVHTTSTYDENDPNANGAIFRVDQEGKVRMLVPAADTSEGAINIIGGLDGVFQSPFNNGVMLHVTGIAGTPGVPSRIYNDAQNSFAAFVARRYNNTAAAPSAVLADEEIMRISGTAHNGTSIPGTGNNRIVYRALGNQTLTNQGGSIELWATPLNSTTIAKIATIDNENGITSTKFTGPLIGTADIATTVTLVATNSTAATHYLTFVDSATGNENVRTDTDLTYNPSTSTLSVTKFSGQYIRSYRDVGVIADAGTVTIDFSTDSIVHVSWDNSFTLAYQNYTAGAVVKLLANKRAGTGTDTFSLDGITAGQVSGGSTTVSSVAGQTTFVEFICTGTDIGSVYAKL